MSDKTPHKLGANRHDPARKRPKRDPNFAQSRDIRGGKSRTRAVRQFSSATTDALGPLPQTQVPFMKEANSIGLFFFFQAG